MTACSSASSPDPESEAAMRYAEHTERGRERAGEKFRKMGLFVVRIWVYERSGVVNREREMQASGKLCMNQQQ